ncbi:MAG TPA: hypothetical protein VNC50_09180, partial [Planctomycetia bacterium]|nr:hypothetical protein [Planctomycetia bacterium]
CDEFGVDAIELPLERPLSVSSIDASMLTTAYVEPLAVRDLLPEMPLFTTLGYHLPLPLEEIYMDEMAGLPAPTLEAIGEVATLAKRKLAYQARQETK